MEKKKSKKCWDFWHCSVSKRNKCKVYKHNYGNRCWFIANCSDLFKRTLPIKDCSTCLWYLINNYLDPKKLKKVFR